MATLRKPDQCNCGSTGLRFYRNPERWDCVDCEATVIARRSLIEARKKCRVCKKSPPTIKFAPRTQANGIICVQCLQQKQNSDVKRWRSKPGKRRLFKATQERSIERSPTAFIKYLVRTKTAMLKRLAKTKFRRRTYLHKVELTADDVMALYEKQEGKCAISGMNMAHVLRDLRAISIDRIDSGKGYTHGNVQLVCQWANMAKGKHSDGEMKAIIDGLRG